VEADRLDAVYLVYNEFKSAISQEVVIEPLLPLVPTEVAADDAGDFLYEPSKKELLSASCRCTWRARSTVRCSSRRVRARCTHDRDGCRVR
jgi:F0F1-type ATP synthase gamma subunit